MPSPMRPLSNTSPYQRASTGLAIRRGDVQISDPVPFTFSHSIHDSTDEEPRRQDTRSDGTWPRKSAPSAFHARRGSTFDADASNNPRASAGPSIIASTVSSAPSKGSLAQKKGGGLRATIRRVFGSKRSRSAVGDGRSYLQKDPGNLTSRKQAQNEQATPRTSPSHNRSVTQPNTLISRSPPRLSPDRYPAPPEEFIRRRRNTLPSIVLSDEEAQGFSNRTDTTQLPARPSTAIKDDEEGDMRLKRRSRSADALAELVNTPKGTFSARQDLAEEIAYWRNSVYNNPVSDSHPPPTTTTDATDSHAAKSTKPTEKKQKFATSPFQTFDFGLGPDTDQPVTLDQRVNTLEVKMFDFEYALAKLQGIDLAKPSLPINMGRKGSVQELFPSSSGPSSMTSATTNDYTFLSSPGRSPPTPSDSRDDLRHDRSSKATTIKPNQRRRASNRSHTPSPSSIRLTADQYDTLLNLINDEKSARQQMEMRILDLQKEVQFLQAPVYASIRSNEDFPSDLESSHAKSLHRSPRFQFQKHLNHQETSRFSMTESELETENATEDGFQDVYETPQTNLYSFETARSFPTVSV